MRPVRDVTIFLFYFILTDVLVEVSVIQCDILSSVWVSQVLYVELLYLVLSSFTCANCHLLSTTPRKLW